MIPNQVKTPMRRLLRPCVRLYQQSAAAAASASAPLPQMSPPFTLSLSSSLTQPSFLGQSDHPHLCPQNSRLISTSCTLCDAAREAPADEMKKVLMTDNGEKEKAILSSSFEELLEAAVRVTSHYQAALVFQRLSTLHKQGLTGDADAVALLHSRQLVTATQLLDRNLKKISPKALLTTLEAVYDMTAEDPFLVKTMATQILWLLRRLPMPLLVQVLQLHLHHQETPLRESIVQQTLSALERRWVELTNVKDIIYLMYNMQGGSTVSQTLTDRLEDRALDVVEQATPKELYRLLYLLSRQRHRNTPLIRAVLYHLNKAALSSLSAVQLANLAYACCVLNIYDVSLLEKITAEVQSKGESLTPHLAASLIASFSRLRWNQTGAVQFLLQILDSTGQADVSANSKVADGVSSDSRKASLEELTVSDRVRLVHSLANLNLNSSQCQSIAVLVTGMSDVQELKQSSPLMWLDVVWSLAVLQRLDAGSAASVLGEDFWGSLPVSESFQSAITMTKLSNINTAAKFEVEGYAGPFLPEVLSNGDAKLLLKGEQRVAEKVISALTNLAPLETFTTTSTACGGYLIDAEFYVDSSGEPRPLSQVTQNSANLHRVALKILDFADLTLPASEPTGLHTMAARHLRHHGFTVVHVLHTEVAGKSKVVELVQFLQQKLKDAIKDGNSGPRS